MWTVRCELSSRCIKERDDVYCVLDAVEDENIITVVQIAPAVRTAWGEGFGLSKDFATAKRLVAGLRRIGFDYIFDTTFSADLTIMEEEANFLKDFQRLRSQDFQCLHRAVGLGQLL